MELHTSEKVETAHGWSVYRRKVPGGWVYTTLAGYINQENLPVALSTVFVPEANTNG